MDHACKNCTNDIEQNFCSHCGQKKYKRIDRKYLIDEIQYIAIHTNKGFFYSIKKILKNPGQTARDFIEGNRVNHYKPIYLAFLLSGLSTFIAYNIIDFNSMIVKYYADMGLPVTTSNQVIAKVSNYISFLSLLLIPIFAIFTRLMFRKEGQNYYEHVIMNAFFQCFYTIIYILIYPLLYIFKENVTAFSLILNGLFLITPLLSIWFYKGFYPKMSIGKILLKVITIFITVLLSFIILTFVAGVIYALFFKKH
ncbi:DUF3667 domain-containing protein [Chryseobacterium sp. T1]